MSLYPYPISHSSFAGDGPPIRPEPAPRVPPKQETTEAIHAPLSGGLPDTGKEVGGTVVVALRPTKTKFIAAKTLRLFVDVPDENFEKASESFNAADLKPQPTQEGAFWFAPGTDAPKVGWKVSQPEKVKKVTFELRCRGGKVVCTKELTDVAFLTQNPWESKGLLEKSKKHGQKKLHCHGSKPLSELFSTDDIKNASIDGTSPFPAGLLTVERSPYKLEMKLEGEEGEKALWPTRAWTYFHVLLGDIELSFFPADVLDKVIPAANKDRDKALYEKLIDANERDNLGDRFPRPPRWADDGSLQQAGETKKVKLRSDTFYSSYDDQMNNAVYERHKHLWGDGPNVPILARPKVKTAQDKLVDNPDLIGAAKFLWDYADKARHFKDQVPPLGQSELQVDEFEDPHLLDVQTRPRSGSGTPPTPIPAGWSSTTSDSGYVDAPIEGSNWRNQDNSVKNPPERYEMPAVIEFLQLSQDYHAAADSESWSPPGFNCHVDRGGKRGPQAKPVYPAQAGVSAEPDDLNQDGTFPFKVESLGDSGVKRWTAVSHAWTKGKYKGCTGVVFSPSRMGGDGYELHVQLGFGDDIAVIAATAEPASARTHGAHAASGRFQVWREVTINRFVALGPTANTMPPEVLADKFDLAYLTFRHTYGAVEHLQLNDPKWVDAIKAVRDDANALPEYIRWAIDATPDALKPVKLFDYNGWKRNVKTKLGLATDASTDQQFFDWAGRQVPGRDWRGVAHPGVWGHGFGYQPAAVTPLEGIEFVTDAQPKTEGAKPGEVKIELVCNKHTTCTLTFPNPKIGHRAVKLSTAQKAQIDTFIDDAGKQSHFKERKKIRVRIIAEWGGSDRQTTRFNNVKTALTDSFNARKLRIADTFSQENNSCYKNSCAYGWQYEIVEAAVRKGFKQDDEEGLTVLHSAWKGPPNGKSKASAVTDDASKTAAWGLVANYVDDKFSTLVHEIGHALLLNHTTDRPGDPRELSLQAMTGGSFMKATGSSDANNLCGFHQLRLRGWSVYKVGADGNVLPAPDAQISFDPADLPARAANWECFKVPKPTGKVRLDGNDLVYKAEKASDNTPIKDTDEDTILYFVYDAAKEAVVQIRVLVNIRDEDDVDPDPADDDISTLNVKPGQEVRFTILNANKHPCYTGVRTLWQNPASNKAPNGQPQGEWHKDWSSRRSGHPII